MNTEQTNNGGAQEAGSGRSQFLSSAGLGDGEALRAEAERLADEWWVERIMQQHPMPSVREIWVAAYLAGRRAESDTSPNENKITDRRSVALSLRKQRL